MKFNSIPKPIITREHGSWAVLFVPMIVGGVYANVFSWNVLLLAFSALGVFLSYVPVHTILYELAGISQGQKKLAAAIFWSVVYFAVGVLFILPLFAQGFWLLLFIGMAGLISFFGNFWLTRKIQKSIASDLVAIAGLTLSAPSGYYVSTGELGITAIVLWLLNFLFFGCSVFYVHMKIKGNAMKRDDFSLAEKFTLGRLNIAYHIFVIGIVVMLSFYHLTKITATFAFVPMVIHAIYGTVKLNRKVKFKNLGLLLLAQSALYGILLTCLWC